MKHKPLLAALSVLIAGGVVVTATSFNPSDAHQAGVVSEPTSVGRVETCTLDAQSGCTVTHGFGVEPLAIVVTNGTPALVGVNPESITDTTYRVVFRRANGYPFRPGTVARFNAHYDLPAGSSPTTATPTASPTPTPTPEPTPTPSPTPTPEPTPTPTPTATPTPTPTPTTSPTPTPTPTGSASPVKTCTNPSFTTVSTNNIGEGREFESYYVHNNMWNNHPGGDNGPAGRYEMRACGHDNWIEIVTQADSPSQAVRAYPNVHKDYPDVPVTRIESARFAHDTTRVSGMRWNVAFDVWINEGSNAFGNELMIWTETHNQRPAGDLVDSSVVIGGVDYELWRLPGGQDIITFRAKETLRFGTMPLQAFFQDLKARDWIPQDATTWQVDYGVEVVDTNNVEHRWNFTDFAITDN
jgi:hypothetical protein